MKNRKRAESKKRSGSLTYKQQRFVAEFVICYNGTKAATLAEYSKKTAAQIAYENLRKPHIVEAVRRQQNERRERADVDRDIVIGELLRLAFLRSSSLFRTFDVWTHFPANVRQKRGMSTFETRVIDYRQRLKEIVETWRTLTKKHAVELKGRGYVEMAIRLLYEELPL